VACRPSGHGGSGVPLWGRQGDVVVGAAEGSGEDVKLGLRGC
jgi:hypothetical protein